MNESTPFIPMPGKVIDGRYRLIEHLADGGMGEVWVAELLKEPSASHDSIAKIVAIKFVSRVNEVSKKHFVRESNIALLLEDNTVMYTIGKGSVLGIHYVVMQYINGITLSVLALGIATASNLDQGSRVELSVHIFRQILFGLMYLHNLHDPNEQPLGIVHRDISPANVIVSGTGAVKILDFGISKADGYEMSGLSETQAIKGTIRYMAAERFRGKATPKSDLYAAAALLYECLSGARFRGEAENAALMMMVVNNEYPELPQGVKESFPELSKLYERIMNGHVENARDVLRHLERLRFPSMRLTLGQVVRGLTRKANETTGYTPFDQRQTWALPEAPPPTNERGGPAEDAKPRPITETVNLGMASDDKTQETPLDYGCYTPRSAVAQLQENLPRVVTQQADYPVAVMQQADYPVAVMQQADYPVAVMQQADYSPQVVIQPTRNASQSSSWLRGAAWMTFLFMVLASLGAVVTTFIIMR